MGRFSDEWLIDRTLFDFVQGGSCACCGFSGLFLPNGTADLVNALASEMETDQQQAELNALEQQDKLPWPPEMRDQVWMERVRLRQKLKREMKDYQTFWKEHGTNFSEWLMQQPTKRLTSSVFQLSRNHLIEVFKQKDTYNVHAAFGAVICAAVEQVAHFEMTGYPVDGRGSSEVDFEEHLIFTRFGGFQLKGLDHKDTKEAVLQVWLARHQSLGGPKLLDRAQKQGEEEEADDGGDADVGVTSSTSSGKPSFRGDRRLIRLVIARIWAKQLQETYLKEVQPTGENMNEVDTHEPAGDDTGGQP